jgi:hypothetical protein
MYHLAKYKTNRTRQASVSYPATRALPGREAKHQRRLYDLQSIPENKIDCSSLTKYHRDDARKTSEEAAAPPPANPEGIDAAAGKQATIDWGWVASGVGWQNGERRHNWDGGRCGG